MRVGAIVREAWCNVVSGTARTVTLALVLTVLGVTAVAAEGATVTELQREAQEFRDAGASVVTVVAPGRIDGDRCDSLTRVAGVRAAGALATPPGQRLTAVALPGAPMTYGRATPGFAAVVHARTDGGAGLLLSGEAARMLGADIGDTLRATEGTTRVAGLYEYPRDGRRNGYGYMALATVEPAHAFDECWVDVWPQNPDARALVLTTVRPATGMPDDGQPEVSALNPTHGLEFDGSARYSERITRWAGVVVGVLVVIVGLVALRARRVELASALHDRMSRIDLAAIVGVECMTWTTPPALLTLVASAAYFGGRGELGVGLVLGARVAALVIAGGLVGACIGLLFTRERDLFLYAKDR